MDLQEILDRDVHERSDGIDARIVDQHVGPLLAHAGRARLNLPEVREVGRDPLGAGVAAAALFSGARADHPRARVPERQGDRAPDPAGGAGDEDRLVREAHGHGLFRAPDRRGLGMP